MNKINQYIFLLLFFLVSCKGSKAPLSSHASGRETSIEKGVASWYGPGFHGKKTANGETFDTRAFTAAHRTLPFNTKLKVKNHANGKTVIVRVNDRGPYAKNRIIDLSKAAASTLGMIEKGTTHVELFLIGQSKSDLDVENLETPTYTIQIASFGNEKNAIAKAELYKGAWVKKTTSGNQQLYRVCIGKFTNTFEAKKKKDQLKSKGINGFVKQIEN